MIFHFLYEPAQRLFRMTKSYDPREYIAAAHRCEESKAMLFSELERARYLR